MKQELIERIGIDKSILKGFALVSADYELLQKMKGNIRNLDSPATDIKTLIDTAANGTETREIIINDKFYGLLKIKVDCENKHITSSLQLSATNGRNNIQNLSAAEYKERLQNAIKHFKAVYRLELDFSGAIISQLELNTTFRLQDDFSQYCKAIKLLMALAANTHYRQQKLNIWLNPTTETEETFTTSNTSTQLKAYNKGQQLRDIGFSFSDNNILRIEYTLLRVINKSLRNPYELTDNKLKQHFIKCFQRDVIRPYKHWKKQNKQEVAELLKAYMTQYHCWISPFIRRCRDENDSRLLIPLLFDVQVVHDILMDLFKGDSHRSRRIKNIMAHFNEESTLEGNIDRAEEILKFATRVAS